MSSASSAPVPAQDGAARRAVNAALLALALWAGGAASAAAEPLRLLALGDSLTAGFGLAPAEGFTAQLQAALQAAGHDVEVINGGVSGDTTAGGRARLDWTLADQPDLALVALGGNDMLRGIEPAASRDNLAAILERLKAEGIPTLLVGMLAAPNLGREYGEAFNAMYPALAEEYGVPLYPFFLEGVALDPALNQPDGLHPNAAGVKVAVKGMLPAVVELIESAGRAAEQG